MAALETASDHLPVVADYQLPAAMDVLLATIPATMYLGDVVDIDVTVENIANVVAAIGADELDYTLSVSGDLFGGISDTAFPLAGGNIHQITLDITVAGIKSGILTVLSISQAVANGLFSVPISFEVLANADFDEDGDVDGADFLTWQQGFGMGSDAMLTCVGIGSPFQKTSSHGFAALHE